MTWRLQNKSYLNTRPVRQAKELSDLIFAEGGRVVEFPVVEIVPNKISEDDRRLMEQVGDDALFVFTSANGPYALEAAESACVTRMRGKRAAAIGERTAVEVKRIGLDPILISDESSSEAFGEALGEFSQTQGIRQVILIRGGKASETLPEILREKNLSVHEISVYESHRTKPEPNAIAAVREGLSGEKKFDAVLLMSSEAVKNFSEMIGVSNVSGVTAVVVGPKTGQEAKSAGFATIRVAKSASARAMVDELIAMALERKEPGT